MLNDDFLFAFFFEGSSLCGLFAFYTINFLLFWCFYTQKMSFIFSVIMFVRCFCWEKINSKAEASKIKLMFLESERNKKLLSRSWVSIFPGIILK